MAMAVDNTAPTTMATPASLSDAVDQRRSFVKTIVREAVAGAAVVAAIASFVLAEHADEAGAPVVKADGDEASLPPEFNSSETAFENTATLAPVEEDEAMLAWQHRMVLIGAVNVSLSTRRALSTIHAPALTCRPTDPAC